jgi:hypothetical protein
MVARDDLKMVTGVVKATLDPEISQLILADAGQIDAFLETICRQIVPSNVDYDTFLQTTEGESVFHRAEIFRQAQVTYTTSQVDHAVTQQNLISQVPTRPQVIDLNKWSRVAVI